MTDAVQEKFRRGFLPKDAYEDQKRLCPDARVIFDIGANIGVMTLKYRALFPDATVYAFEPSPNAFKQLCQRFQQDSRVMPVAKAAAAATGPTFLYTNSMEVTNALSPIKDEALRFLPKDFLAGAPIPIEAIRLDDYAAQNGVEHIDILKMDAQGAELLILQGAQNLLTSGKIDLVYAEMIFVPVYEGQCAFFETAEYLARFGYTVFDFYSFTYDESGQLKWGDAVFRRAQM